MEIQHYIEDNPAIWNATIYGADRYVEELGYFRTREEAEHTVDVELKACEESTYVYGEHAYIRGFNLTSLQNQIAGYQKDIQAIQTVLDKITNIIGE